MSTPAQFTDSNVVVASPTDDAETVVASLTGVSALLSGDQCSLWGVIEITPNVLVSTIEWKIRYNNISGDSLIDGATDGPANLAGLTRVNIPVECPDPAFGDTADATYVLTVQCHDAGGASTVNKVGFHARTGGRGVDVSNIS